MTAAVALPEPGDIDWPTVPAVPRPPTIIRGRPLTPEEVEELIAEYVAWLEDAAEWLEQRGIAAAVAEARYQRRKNQRIATASGKTATDREAIGRYHASDENQGRLVAAALASSMADAIRTRRGILDALRTLAANARAARHAGGF